MNPPRFDLSLTGGITRARLSEAEIAELMRHGQVHRSSPCALSGSNRWQTIDDLLPLLKWEHRSAVPLPCRISFLNTAPHTRSGESQASPIRAGWICFALGLSLAWICPLAHVFYSVAIVLSVVALCRLPLRHGLSLLVCSLLGIVASIFISLAVGVGMITAAFAWGSNYSLKSHQDPVPTQVSPPFDPLTSAHLPNGNAVFSEPNTFTFTSKRTAVRAESAAAKHPTTPIPRQPIEETTISLGVWQTVSTRYGTFSVKIIDHGPATFSLYLNGSDAPRRIEKIKGFETSQTNRTKIYSLARAEVFYIDRISVSPGQCVLAVEGRQ